MTSHAVRARARPEASPAFVALVVVAGLLAVATDWTSHPARTPGADSPATRSGLPTPGGAVAAPPPAADRPVQLRLPPAEGAPVVALTFDDGPDPRWTPAVLDLLRRHRARATFCLVGVHARRHPELVRRIAAEGHVLCNHTWSHPARLDLQPAATVRKQLLDTNQAITAAAGGTVPRFFRAPGGRWSPVVRAEAARLDLSPLRWSVDPADWAGAAAPAISQRVLARTEPGAIVLLHDGYGNRAATVAALPVILAALSRDGYRFGTP